MWVDVSLFVSVCRFYLLGQYLRNLPALSLFVTEAVIARGFVPGLDAANSSRAFLTSDVACYCHAEWDV